MLLLCCIRPSHQDAPGGLRHARSKSGAPSATTRTGGPAGRLRTAGSARFTARPGLRVGLIHRPPYPTQTDNVAWNPLVFTADVALPIINLGQEGHWALVGIKLWISTAITLFGWLVAGSILACLPRTLRRR